MFCLIFSLLSFNKYKNTGNVQTFTAPSATTYKLEVWGAQGSYGDKVGYSYGERTISKNNQLFICVGQQGLNGDVYSNITSGTYNGGGGGKSGGQGGGATHIAITNDRGELYNYKNNPSEIILVAGGSGGTESNGLIGGFGGGGNNNGGNGSYKKGKTRGYGTGGTQSAGGIGVSTGEITGTTSAMLLSGSFGKGGGCDGTDLSGGGGGGWYGGGGIAVNQGAGGGGSGHIGNGFISGTTGGYSVDRAGDGYAIITWHPTL